MGEIGSGVWYYSALAGSGSTLGLAATTPWLGCWGALLGIAIGCVWAVGRAAMIGYGDVVSLGAAPRAETEWDAVELGAPAKGLDDDGAVQDGDLLCPILAAIGSVWLHTRFSSLFRGVPSSPTMAIAGAGIGLGCVGGFQETGDAVELLREATTPPVRHCRVPLLLASYPWQQRSWVGAGLSRGRGKTCHEQRTCLQIRPTKAGD